MNKTTGAESQLNENASNAKPAKRIRELRKKDEKSLEQVFRALDSLGSTEHKLGAMCQKYAEMYNDHRMLQTSVKQAEKKNMVLQKEKDQLQSEHSKAILTRSRLENLCRELQRQNKAVKEECMLKMREEGEKKREVASKFHSLLAEIETLLAQNNNKNAKLRDDNLDMSMKLKSVCDQFEKKEQHVENLAKQMELEVQLADAKLAKARMEIDIERETLEKQKQQLLIEMAEQRRKIVEMKASELALREQIAMYSEKYDEFHKALLQSNSAIGEFKAEMERMTKHIRRLEKETATWMSRYDGAQKSLAEVTQGKEKSDEALALSERRLSALQGICRGLQEQCRQLRGSQRRDSKAEEEFRKIEDQIKEVERSAEIDAQPCPRKVASQAVLEAIQTEESQSALSLPSTPGLIPTECSPVGEDNCASDDKESCVAASVDPNFPTIISNLPVDVEACNNTIEQDSPRPSKESPTFCSEGTQPVPGLNHENDDSLIDPEKKSDSLITPEELIKSIDDNVISLVNCVKGISLTEMTLGSDLRDKDHLENNSIDNKCESSASNEDVSASGNPVVEMSQTTNSQKNDLSKDHSLIITVNGNAKDNSSFETESKIPSTFSEPNQLSPVDLDVAADKGSTNSDDAQQSKNKKKRKSKK